MGCFGYICKGCGTSIRGNCMRGGEKCVMIHVRHGKEMGRVEGHYDEYGRVIEQEGLSEDEKFRGDGNGINGHSEICDSEFRFDDSHYCVNQLRYFKGEKVDISTFITRLMEDELGKHNYCPNKCDFYPIIYDEEILKSIDIAYAIYNSLRKELKGETNLKKKYDMLAKARSSVVDACVKAARCGLVYYYKTAWGKLKRVKLDKYSGIVAWHSKCYNKASEEEKKDLTPSLSDPDQSWGKIRKQFI